MKSSWIGLREYENVITFIYQNCNPVLDKEIPLLNCDGEILNGEEDFKNLGQFVKRTII